MKKILVSICLVCISWAVGAQNVKIVFDVTSEDPKIHQSTMRHVSMMAEAYPDSEFEVVIYSGALDMVLKDKSSVASDIEKFAGLENVSFNVCAMTLKRHNLDESNLLQGVGTVPDGILEIVKRQGEGWGYIKEAH